MRWISTVALTYEGPECLIWPFGRTSYGYGKLHVGKRQTSAHRFICEQVYGDPPTADHDATHLCGRGNDGCVNPNHLCWKTHIENMDDKLIHGSHTRGEKVGTSKLTEDDVRSIRRLCRLMTQSAVARMYDLDHTTVYGIVHGKRWGWLDDYAYPDPVKQAIKEAKKAGSPFVCEEVE